MVGGTQMPLRVGRPAGLGEPCKEAEPIEMPFYTGLLHHKMVAKNRIVTALN